MHIISAERAVSRAPYRFHIASLLEKSARKALFLSAFVLAANLAMAEVSAAAAQDAPRFSVSPRFFLTWISGSEDEDQPLLPLYGLSGTVRLAPGWDLSVTGLYGEGSSGSFDSIKESSIERMDIETLVRYRFPESGGYVVGGFRNINVNDRETRNGVFDGESDTQIYVGEIGGGFATRFSKSGRHAGFANLVFGVGVDEFEFTDASGAKNETSGTAYLVDGNIGYQYAISGSFSFSARYRLIVLNIEVDNNISAGTVHGPEIAATFRF